MAKEVPLSTNKFQIGLLTVLILIALRLALGCHFLYEGVWKITHAYKFSAEPFLSQAKGPVAPLFYAMLDDINGRQRLRVGADSEGKKIILVDALNLRWQGIRDDFVAFYAPTASDADSVDAKSKLEEASKKTLDEFQEKAKTYLNENAEDIAKYFTALDRFEGKVSDPHLEIGQTAPFQQKRHWDEMLALRGEVGVWVKEIEADETALKHSLCALLTDKQKAKGSVPCTWNVLKWSRTEQLNFMVTAGITAIGLCLMLGLCSRLAALGGAAFMCFVVMTQPAFPTIYPPDLEMLGHALLINKDFIEMMTLLLIASLPVGRWAGLDFFLYRIFQDIFGCRAKVEAPKPEIAKN
jgi:uncharacterized membrane protein YphA (DoxX/SURF4 family)